MGTNGSQVNVQMSHEQIHHNTYCVSDQFANLHILLKRLCVLEWSGHNDGKSL